MTRSRMQTLIAVVLACGLLLTSTTLFAQARRVPVGPPTSARSHAPSVPHYSLPEAVPAKPRLGGTHVGQSYDGIDFNGSNCGCLPPDNGTAVGNNYVVEAVNVQIRIFDKTTGAILLDEPLSTFFGAPSGGDPYMVYDELADRWYMNAFDSSDSGLFFAVSKDGNPLDGFTVYDLTAIGGFPDYAKPGYNKDAVFISLNDFGSDGGGAAVVAIDKAKLLAGTLVYYFTYPPFFQFRAFPPARMHGDLTGGTEWFVSTFDDGAPHNTIQVTKMTNYLSNSPTYTTWNLPVNTFSPPSLAAEQPGDLSGAGSITTFPNTTTTQVQYHHGRLVTAQGSGTARDGFLYNKSLYYQIDVHTGTPKLMQEGIVDPGSAVSAQMPSVEQDAGGGFGITWIESSLSEYLSMWVGTRPPIFYYGGINANQVAPGGSFMVDGFRIGDYSSTVLDSDGVTFWSSNEFVGPDGANDIWSTHITQYHR